MNRENRLSRVIKPALFFLCLLPALLLGADLMADGAGADPVEAITHRTGDWALRLLLITLAITPLRRLTGLHMLIRLRRMLGLFAFFYAALHFATYLFLDQGLNLYAIVDDILERPYITLGMLGFVLLIPLAVTSNKAMIRRLGARRWQDLHRWVYVVAVAAVLHYALLVKADLRDPVIYGAILAALLGYRLWWTLTREARRSAGAVSPFGSIVVLPAATYRAKTDPEESGHAPNRPRA
jgi:sulfoxide reductase heme-binding subunit YedZ